MYNQKFEKPFWTIKHGPVSKTSFSNLFLGNLALPMSTSSLSLSASPSLSFSVGIPIRSRAAHHVYLLVLDSKSHARGSPRVGSLCYSSGRRWPNVNGANLLSQGFISFPSESSYSAYFLHCFFQLHYSFLICLYF